MPDQLLTPLVREQFLDELRRIPNVVRACRAVKISRARMYEVYQAEPDFAKQWDAALKEGVESLEAEAHRRAFEGYAGRPVVNQGQVYEVTEYSDTLTTFLLRAHAPDKYRDNASLEIKGTLGIVDAIREGRKTTGLG